MRAQCKDSPWGTTCLCSVPASAAQKWKVPKLLFFDILATQNHQISYVKHVSDPFSPYLGVFFWGGGRGCQGGRGTPCPCSFPASAAQKCRLPKLMFFYILTIHNCQISYVRHVLDPIHVLVTLFGCLDGGKGLGHNLLMQFSTLGGSTMEIFKTDFFDVLAIHNDQIPYAKHVSDPLYVFFRRGACRGGHGRLNSTWPPSPPLCLCT